MFNLAIGRCTENTFNNSKYIRNSFRFPLAFPDTKGNHDEYIVLGALISMMANTSCVSSNMKRLPGLRKKPEKMRILLPTEWEGIDGTHLEPPSCFGSIPHFWEREGRKGTKERRRRAGRGVIFKGNRGERKSDWGINDDNDGERKRIDWYEGPRRYINQSPSN